MRYKRRGFGLILGGCFLVLVGLVLMMSPYATFAAPGDEEEYRIRVNPPDMLFNLGNMNPGDTVSKTLEIINEGSNPVDFSVMSRWVAGDPLPGQPGDLYNQLLVTVTWEGKELYNGLLSGLDSNLFDSPDLGALVGKLDAGDTARLDFTVHLDGPGTGNEFQGSTLTVELILFIEGDSTIIVPPEDPGVDPPDLPQTSGTAYLYITALGLLMIITGLLLSREARTGRA